ncbi:septal ring lytic transglycosylase RlpA family protein [Helicobacter aurati]|uniref:Probable endolytic peptidoglycan transglycosylase RlpA n=2 Tax=Helicobacter aurati TaxID=137778 RepID=A0A3D8J7T0_9HELI|nr:septal ring lytic transglycosylase RlpA family protein [Helicobacter aurati]
MRESEAIQRATMRPYTIRGKTYRPHPVKVGDTFDGIASWYGPDFHAKATSNGETYNMHAHTAAHKTLPMNTIVSVFNKDNGKSTVVRINDRGPFVEGRIIDLSNVAARDIQMVGKGVANVRIEVVGFGGDLQNNNPKSATKITQDSKKSPATPKATISVAQDSQVDSHVSSSKPESQRILASDEIKSQPPEPIQLSTPPESLSSNTSLGAADSNANRLYSDNSTETKQQVSSQTKTKGSNLDSHKLEVIEDTLDEPIVSMVLPNQNPHLVKSAPLAQNSHSNQLTQRDVSNNSDTPVADSKNIPINKEEQKQEATQAVQNENANNDSFEPIMSDIDNTIQKLKDSTNHLQMQQNKAESHKPQSESEFQDSPKEMSNLLESEIQKPLATQDMSKDTPINNSKAQSAPDTSSTDNLGNTKKQKGRYMISLNVFSQEERAKRFRDEIYAKFQNTSYDVDVIKTDKGLYRVALRGFQNSDEARAFINSKAIVGHIVAE